MALNFSSCSSIPTSIPLTNDFGVDCSRRESNNPTNSGRMVGWGGSDGHFDPVDFLPMDPFGMNMQSTLTAAMAGWIGDSGGGDRWLECFDPADLLPLDPFGMNLETAIASLIEDFRAAYDCHDRDDNWLDIFRDCSDEAYLDSANHSSSDAFMDIEATLSAAIAGWIEVFRAISGDYSVVEDQHYRAFDHRFDAAFLEDYLDPVYMLPSDPFGMHFEVSLTATIARLIEDITDRSANRQVGDNHLFSGTMVESDMHVESLMKVEPVMSVESLFNLSGSEEACLDGGHGNNDLHDGLLFALSYLGVRDLLSVERVCKSLHTAVTNDPLLWRCIKVDFRLSDKITDDGLLRLTQRSQGTLQSLIMVGCTKITDNGLRRVLDDNPRLSKLYILDCVRLSIGGIINNLKAFQSHAITGIKHLKLGRFFSVSQEQFQELKLLLGIDQFQQEMACRPRFYHVARFFLECDNDRALDIEMCPLCKNYKVVYDCPSEGCKGKGCRACELCIMRCVQCGRCIKDSVYVETFCFEYLCSDCWKNPLFW